MNIEDIDAFAEHLVVNPSSLQPHDSLQILAMAARLMELKGQTIKLRENIEELENCLDADRF